jgi:hypothetical protein
MYKSYTHARNGIEYIFEGFCDALLHLVSSLSLLERSEEGGKEVIKTELYSYKRKSVSVSVL